MKINIQSPHFVVDEALTSLVNTKVNRLAKFNERIQSAEVYLKLDKASEDDNKVCEIKLMAPEKNLFATRKSLTFEEALIHTVRALEQQIEKKKTRWEGNSEEIHIEDEEEETE